MSGITSQFFEERNGGWFDALVIEALPVLSRIAERSGGSRASSSGVQGQEAGREPELG